MGRGATLDDSFDEKRLAAALRTAQPEELRAGFERHFDAMSVLAWALTGGSEADVGRLIEAAWVSAVADFARDSPRSARVWLFARLIGKLIDGPGLAPEAPDFLPAGDAWEGHWAEFPVSWRADSEGWEYSPGGRAVLEDLIRRLSPLQRTVLIVRDVDAWSVPETAALTGLLPDRQRAVLHQARLAIRTAIDPLLRETEPEGQEAGTQGHG